MTVGDDIMKVCPNCGATEIKRIYIEFEFYVIVIGVAIAVLSNMNLFSFMPDYMRNYFVTAFVVGLIFIKVILPLVCNLKTPQYMCKRCGNKFS